MKFVCLPETSPGRVMFCEGQLLPISENETLFNLIGTTYGGDGQSTFALPDLRGRIPIHQGNGSILAETGGTEEITFTVNQIPAHSHPMFGSTNVSQDTSPSNKVVGQSGSALLYIQDTTDSNIVPLRYCRSVVVSRTQTFSHTSVSTSSFRCLGFFRAQRNKKGLGVGD